MCSSIFVTFSLIERDVEIIGRRGDYTVSQGTAAKSASEDTS